MRVVPDSNRGAHAGRSIGRRETTVPPSSSGIIVGGLGLLLLSLLPSEATG
jgi:hypothetical protein